MNVIATKLTDVELVRKAASSTSGKESHISLLKAYMTEHSIIRTQMFWIEMTDIPSFVSVHFVRHKVGAEHYVKSNRDDRGGDAKADRETPVNHCMLVNAQALINMAQMRLCNKAHAKTREVMQMIVDAVAAVDPVLSKFLVRKCVYRNGLCGEPKCCGYINTDKHREEQDAYNNLFLEY